VLVFSFPVNVLAESRPRVVVFCDGGTVVSLAPPPVSFFRRDDDIVD